MKVPITGALDVAALRLDGDDRIDLAVSNFQAEAGLLQIFGGNPDTAATEPLGSAYALAVADVAPFEYDDLIAGIGGNPSTLVMLRRTSPQTFEPLPYALPMGCGGPVSIAVAELDGNAAPDAVVACAGFPGVYVAYGADGGGFGGAPPAVLMLGVVPSTIAVVQVADSSDPDLIVASIDFESVTTYLGESGSFNAAPDETYEVPQAAGMAYANLDADPWLEVGVFELGGAQCWLFPGTMIEGIGEPQTFACGVGPRWIAFADLDDDGDSDIVTLLATSMNLALNDGFGVFEVGESYPVVQDTFRVAIADFDGDGDVDIASTSTDALYLFLQV